MFAAGFEFAPGYRLESFLGRGQFGQVWRTTGPGGTQAAVKFVDLNHGQWEKENEGIQRIKQVRHPNLMPILAIWLLGENGKVLAESAAEGQAAGTVNGLTFETLEIDAQVTKADWLSQHQGRGEARWLAVAMTLGGRNLLQRLKECQQQGHPGIPPKELLNLMDEAAKGLDYLNSQSHDLGLEVAALQHCDVKPANIVIVGSSAVVCDFGLARIMSREQVTASTIAGTPAYMAPEAIGGKPSRSSDQYSLAVTYYHLRSGSLPLSDGSLWQVLDAHRMGKLNFDQVSEAERAVLRKATALQWDARYDSNAEMIEALRDAWKASSAPKLAAIDTVIAPVIARPVDTPRAWWHRPAFLAIGMLALLGVLALLVQFIRPDRDGFGDPPPLNGLPPIVPSETARNWDPVAWEALLARALTDLPTAASEFPSWVESFPELAKPLPIGLPGHSQDLEQAVWASPWATANSATETVLITRANDPAVMLFRLSALTPLVARAAGQLAGQASADGGSVAAAVGLRMPPHLPFTSALGLSPDSRWVASGGFDGRVQIWPSDQPATAGEAKVAAAFSLGDVDVEQLVWHPNQDHLVATDVAGGIHLIRCPRDWSATTDPPARQQFSLRHPIIQLAIDRGGKTLILLDSEGQLHTLAWEACEAFLRDQTKPEPQKLSTPGAVIRRFRLSDPAAGESTVLTDGENGDWSQYSLARGELLARLTVVNGPVLSSDAVNTTGGWLCVAGGAEGELVLKLPLDSAVTPLSGHRMAVTDIAIAPDGQWVASVSQDGWGTLRRLGDQVQDFITFQDLTPGELTLVAWAPSGEWLITGGYDGRLSFWDARHLRLLTATRPQTSLSEPGPAAAVPETQTERAVDPSGI